MSLLIAFSGACHSGKTTTLTKISQALPEIEVLSEAIRELNIQDIDELRRDADAYFETQVKVISKKIMQENQSLLVQPGITIADRSLVDSLFYYSYYVNPSQLKPANKRKYFHLLSHLAKAIPSRYHFIFLFKPIPVTDDHSDSMRPRKLLEDQDDEFMMIQQMMQNFYPTNHLVVSAVSDFDKIFNLLKALNDVH